jgi:hypothetical protein
MKLFCMLKLQNRNSMTQVAMGEHKAKNLAGVHDELNAQDFILIDEFVIDRATGAEVSIGQSIINGRAIGKIREYRPRATFDMRPDQDHR